MARLTAAAHSAAEYAFPRQEAQAPLRGRGHLGPCAAQESPPQGRPQRSPVRHVLPPGCGFRGLGSPTARGHCCAPSPAGLLRCCCARSQDGGRPRPRHPARHHR
eukprot:10414174-Alexandrium_andersonii.AAC.1